MLEHAVLRVRAGDEAAFEDSARQALPLIESAPGCHGAEFRRQAEDPSVYLLLVRWDSIEAAPGLSRDRPLRTPGAN